MAKLVTIKKMMTEMYDCLTRERHPIKLGRNISALVG